MRILFLPILAFLLIPYASAHCPLCTAAVGVGAVYANSIGLDISIIGLFIGAFGISTGLWIGKKIKKNYFKFQLPIITISSFLLTIIPLRFISKDNIFLPVIWFGTYGSLFNKVYVIDKLILGGIIGAVITILAYNLHTYIKKVKGKVLFPFQGIAFTLAFLFIATGILYLLIQNGS